MRAGLLITAAVLYAAVASAEAESQKKLMSKRTFNFPPRPHPRDISVPALNGNQQEELRSLPTYFDWCDKGFCGPSWNQHIPQYCGSCYLHGSLSAYQDRALIHGVQVTLGRQSFLNCAPGRNYTNGCHGGEPAEVFEYMQKYGIPDDSCLPYNATDNSKWGGGECPAESECLNCMYIQGTQRTECWPVKTFTKYRAKKWGRVVGELDMMKEIYKSGPITCSISCPDGFTYDYREGIFEDKTNNRDVDHDVEVVGWGEENGVKYWHVRNSWGTYWGMNGFFKVVRGKDNIAIESDCWWVDPDLSEVKLVSGKRPRYGGSQYGIVDMKTEAEPLDSIVEPEFEEVEMAGKPDEIVNVVVSSHTSGSSVLFFAVIAISAVALFVNRERIFVRRGRTLVQYSDYSTIN